MSARASHIMSVYSLWRRRERDCGYSVQPQAFSTRVHGRLYEKFSDGAVLDPGGGNESPYGSVFNVEFSPRGDFVVAVCAARAFVVYDPRFHSKVHAVPFAHDDCVNCVTFLDEALFATCSDDKTIRLWDFRNLRSSLGTLRGHQNWIKNIEYDAKSGYLFSVAFSRRREDGVRFWDLKNMEAYSEEGAEPSNLLHTVTSPLRMRLSPDGSKMFISSRSNKCALISDFNGEKLPEMQELYDQFFREYNIMDNDTMHRKFSSLSCNKPSLYEMCKCSPQPIERTIMSMAFHPSSQFLGMRHVDIIDDEIQHELTTLFQIDGDTKQYVPSVGVKALQKQYLKYVDESLDDESADYIKEICFSRDGRVLASPYRNGVRILSVDSNCSAMDVFYSSEYNSREKVSGCLSFDEICIISPHYSPVLTCKFAHNDLILATGAFDGSVAFSSPRL